MKKIIFIIIFSVAIYGCGYTPIYSVKNNNTNFMIESVGFKSGDSVLNNYLRIYLRRYSLVDREVKLFVSVETDYQKLTILKNIKGEATEYKLIADAKFSISHNDLIVKEFSITETLIIENNDNKFEESSYERTVKQTFANSISEKLIMRLADIKIINDK